MSTARNVVQRGLVRAIGRWSLAALAINSVIGSGVFGLPAIVGGLLGRYSILAVLIAAVAIGIIMGCFAEVSSRFSEAGGPYLYARVAFGRLLGIQVGWFFYLALSAATAASGNLFVIYFAEFWPAVREPWPRFLILTALIVLLTLINLIGVRQGTLANNSLTIAKIVALLLVIVAGAAILLSRPVSPPISAVHMGSGAWLKATVLLVFLFGGFESALTPMSEAKDPQRDAAFALVVTLFVCAAIYALIQAVVVLVLGSAASDRPLADVARLAMGNRGAAVVALGAMVSVYGYLGAKLLGMPRVTFALAEQGDLPQIFCAVSGRFHTPWFSILFFAVVIWVLAIIGNFAWNVTLSVIARLFYYAVTCAALIGLRHKQPGAAKFRLPAGPLFAVLGIGICILLASEADLSQSKILAMTVVAATANWWLVRQKKPQAEA